MGLLRLLLEFGADPNKCDDDHVALKYACANANVEMVDLLLDSGAESGGVDRRRLHVACLASGLVTIPGLLAYVASECEVVTDVREEDIDIDFSQGANERISWI